MVGAAVDEADQRRAGRVRSRYSRRWD